MINIRNRTHLIAAVDANWGIGLNGAMAWHDSAELKYFQAMTRDRILIVGRRTADSLIALKPGIRDSVYTHEEQNVLPNRILIVVTRREHTRDYTQLGLHVADSLEAALAKAGSLHPTCTVMIAGGTHIYKEALDKDLVELLHISHLKETYKCDTFFPKPDSKVWMRRNLCEHATFSEYVYLKRKVPNEPSLYSS